MKQRMMLRLMPLMMLAFIAAAIVSTPARKINNPLSAVSDLSNIDQLKQRIQQDPGKVRLIALLSPV